MNVGLIGLGYWGKHYVRIINNSNRCKLVSLCDLNEKVFEKYN
jgi:predicted dehydrogenase